jgi:glutamine synthetase
VGGGRLHSGPVSPDPSVRSDDTDLDAVLAEVEAAPDQVVKVAVTDIDGVLRGKYLDKGKFLSAARKGFGFCNVVFGWDSSDQCYDNTSYTGWQSGYPDAQVRIDLSTRRRIPWEQDRLFFLGEFVDEAGDPLAVCPRQLLRRVLDDAATEGLSLAVGLEFEWFNFLETSASSRDKGYRDLTPLTPGMFGYSILRQSQNQPYFDALLSDLRAFGVPLEGLHTETGPGVFEAAIAYGDALEAADRAVLFKSSAKEIGSRLGILASFMARWNSDLPGCSGHIHQSLWRDGANLFFDPAGDRGLSTTARAYVAGQLALLPEILVLLAPTVNSYKRLVEGYWAPTTPSWGVDNRTVACRLIPGGAGGTRLESRVPGSDINPYLATAACVAAGVWGVRQQLELDVPETRGSGYADGGGRLATDLAQATAGLDGSKVMRGLLGDGFVDHFVATRDWEWRRSQAAVTDWELARYFEII